MNQRALEAGARADALFDGRAWQAMPKSERQRYTDRSRGYHDALHEAGFVVVPREPTQAMRKAAVEADDKRTGSETCAHIFRIMIAAAQEPTNASD